QLSGVNSPQENSPQVHGGIAILVHRSTSKQLDHACQYIENWFQRPAWVIREKEYAGRIWLQTFPIVWERLLETPFNRCQKYLTSEVPGVIPLVMTKAIDSQGLELIADEGGTPIHLDLFNQYKNLAILGTNGAGKSVLVCGILTQALALGIPIVALDYPKPDGSFTFTDYANFFKGNSAYWNISQVLRNLSRLPKDAQLLFFALGNSSEVQDAAVCAAIRQALSHQASTFKAQGPILFIDEAPNLLEFEHMAELVSQLCDKRNAQRVRVILSAQEPAAIANSKVTAKIFQNFPTRLIGKIQKGAIDSFEQIWKYPGEIISRNASESFLPNRESFYSQWLLDDNGSYTFCRYYPAYEQLAVVANHPNEQAKRNQIMKEYIDKYEGLSVLARELVGKVSGV
ncbi:MAG: DUF87 domain-containing protein, partial [Symploca sp. SIO3E6]|nr:DUF87 domain-containing protein [Caldora sp. SIO3E6]